MATIDVDYNEIIDKNMGLVKSIVKRFRPKNKLEYDEFCQCGRIALWEAAKKHDPKLGAFSTIAYPRIIWEISGYIKKKNKRPHNSLNEAEYNHKEQFWESLPQNLTDDEKSIINLLIEGHKRVEIYTSLEMSQTKFNTVLKTAIRKIKRANLNDKNSIL